MTREEKIEILVEDRMWEWVYARNYEGLQDALMMGFQGFETYTDKELDEAIDDLEENVDEIKKMIKQKGGEVNVNCNDGQRNGSF